MFRQESIYIVILGWILHLTALAEACPSGWITHGSSCYLFVDQREPWHQAMHFCQSFNGHLVQIDSKQESDFLNDWMKKIRVPVNGLVLYWTAGNDIQEEGTWTWAPNSLPFNFSNWCPHEPNNDHNRNEDCLELVPVGPGGDYCWNDEECDYRNHYGNIICEKRDTRECESGQVIG